jgi:hypothetical protein
LDRREHELSRYFHPRCFEAGRGEQMILGSIRVVYSRVLILKPSVLTDHSEDDELCWLRKMALQSTPRLVKNPPEPMRRESRGAPNSPWTYFERSLL